MYKSMNKKIGWLMVMVMVMTVLLAACGNNAVETSSESTSKIVETKTSNTAQKVVNIGVTDTLSSLNPLLEDATEVVKYATSLSFLTLVELDKDLNFQGQLASSITTEDNKHFTIKLDEKAKWSDGKPVTSEDVLFSFLCLASPEVGNSGMSIYKIEGIGDDGYVAAGADSISGVIALDEKTVQITTKSDMALYAFENIFGRYIHILPKHVLADVPKADLLKYEWFNAPTVVSGPYFIKDFDLNHYVTYEANDNYWKGTPKIKNLNIKIVTSSQLLTGLQSGELDLVQQTTGAILQEDYESVEALDNVQTYYGTPITNQSIYFNTERITDPRIRQALLYGIDRQTIFNEIMKGKGEVIDGFLASASPFYDKSLTPTPYDPEKSEALLKEAAADGWDSSTQYSFYVNSGDTTFIQVANFIAAQMEEIGLKLQVNTVDLSTLMSTVNNGESDIMAVQYTFAPVDPYTDVDWLLSKTGWTRYANDHITTALAKTQSSSDMNEVKAQYHTVGTYMQQEVPMLSVYVISALGAKSKRLENATPDVYGTFINVQDWDIAQ